MNKYILLICLWMTAAGWWLVYLEYRIRGLETRMNVHEASEHWQDTPPEVQK